MKNLIKVAVAILIIVVAIIIGYAAYMWYPYMRDYIEMKEKKMYMHTDEYVSEVVRINEHLDSVVQVQEQQIFNLTKKVDSLNVELRAERQSSRKISESIHKDISKLDSYIKSQK